MRIILDTDKKTITVPWNYQQKLDEINRIIMEVSNDETKKKTFTGYIDEMWQDCIKNSDSRVKTGEKHSERKIRNNGRAQSYTAGDRGDDRLYAKIGNYAEVGRRLGRSGSTVAKYIKLAGTTADCQAHF